MPRCEFIQQLPKGSHLKVIFDGKGTPGMVGVLAEIQEILTQQRCQACIDLNRDPDEYGAVFQKRTPQTYVYYGMKCLHPDCGAELEFSQRKEESGGGMYVKRRETKAKGGAIIEHRGWTWYKSDDHPQSAEKAQVAAPQHEPVPESEIPF